MKSRWPILALLCAFVLAPPLARADEKKGDDKKPAAKAALKTYQVPYLLTKTQHVMVRAKINGKGPFNFIVDTGAPLLYVSIPAAKKIGLPASKEGGEVVTLKTFDIEGGIRHQNIKCIVETPFQLRGMNALGLPGAELHGVIGYTLLAHYKMEFDFTRDRMAWTRLDFKPPAPKPLGLEKKDGDPTGLENLGGLMEAFALLLGKKMQPPALRGFLGFEVADGNEAVTVKSVLEKSPAAEAGLKPGDRISHVGKKRVSESDALHRLTGRVLPGETVRLTVQRGDERREITITAGEGL